MFKIRLICKTKMSCFKYWCITATFTFTIYQSAFLNHVFSQNSDAYTNTSFFVLYEAGYQVPIGRAWKTAYEQGSTSLPTLERRGGITNAIGVGVQFYKKPFIYRLRAGGRKSEYSVNWSDSLISGNATSYEAMQDFRDYNFVTGVDILFPLMKKSRLVLSSGLISEFDFNVQNKIVSRTTFFSTQGQRDEKRESVDTFNDVLFNAGPVFSAHWALNRIGLTINLGGYVIASFSTKHHFLKPISNITLHYVL